jgi:hypothetical protein
MKVADFAGIVDTGSVARVNIYNANQYALSKSVSISAPVGTLIGNAAVRAVKWYSGTKGTAQAIYHLYVNDVQMAAGYSFGADARSIYLNGTYGKIFGDIVRDAGSGQSTLYQTDSTNKSLLFYTGLDGTKRLLSSAGVNATSYIFRTTSDPVTATKTTNYVYATFSTTDEYNFGATTGLSDTASLGIDVYFNTDVVANLYSGAAGSRSVGSVSGTANNTHTNVSCSAVTGGAGSFVNSPAGYTFPAGGLTTTQATVDAGVTPRVGDTLRATHSGGVTYHTVTGVYSASLIGLTPNLSSTAIPTNIYFNRFHKAGSTVDFNGGSNIISFSSIAGKITEMVANVCLRDAESTSYTMRAQIPQIKNQATPIEKVTRKSIWVAVNCATHATGTNGPWSLGFPDVYKIDAIHLGSNFSNTNPDRKDWFAFDNGQRDNLYGLSYITVLPQYKSAITSSTRLFVRLKHLTPNTTGAKAGFFSVDSYKTNDSDLTDMSALQTAEIPIYKDIAGQVYDLRNHIDFRPVMVNTAISDQTGVWPNFTVNPANTNPNFYTHPTIKAAIEPDSNFTYNIEYYLPRVDTLIINKDGHLNVKSSVPSFKAKPPIISDTGLKIADVYVTPYPSLTFPEAE